MKGFVVLAPTPSSRSLTAANNRFALALFRQIRQRPGNLCCSPFSICTTLTMACAGAQGETVVQMEKTLGFSASSDELLAPQLELLERLNAAGGGRYEMAIANSLWTQDGVPLQTAFLDRITKYFGGGSHTIDFRHAGEPARASINRWIEEHTRRRIVELIPPGGLPADTRLVLVNAVYFKGKWVSPFDPEDTQDEPFYLAGGETVRAPLMCQQEMVRYLEAPGYQAVQLDYEGGDLAMLVLLPDRRDGLQDLENQLSIAMLEDCINRMADRTIKLYMPRFTTTWGTVDLQPALAALGMSLPFDQQRADFSGVNGLRPPHPDALFIGAVFHKAFTEVNEEGTEAAAATAVQMRAGSAPSSRPPQTIPVFRADHPFLYLIRDRPSGGILFVGRVSDPTRED